MNDRPYHNEPGYEQEVHPGDAQAYNDIIRHETIRVAVCDQIDFPGTIMPKEFQSCIESSFSGMLSTCLRQTTCSNCCSSCLLMKFSSQFHCLRVILFVLPLFVCRLLRQLRSSLSEEHDSRRTDDAGSVRRGTRQIRLSNLAHAHRIDQQETEWRSHAANLSHGHLEYYLYNYVTERPINCSQRMLFGISVWWRYFCSPSTVVCDA